LGSGYYAACAGLRAQSQALELIASNVANISTTGYRGQQALFHSLLASAGHQLSDPLNHAINDFGVLEGSRTDLATGNLERTGNSLDLAMEGKGFFAIQTQGFHSLDDNFQISPKGQLTTAAGDLVLGEGGKPITMPSSDVSISPDGTLSASGAVAGKLKIVKGNGFLPIQTRPDTLYTRNGNFQVSAKGQLTTAAGDLVLGEGRLPKDKGLPIVLPSGDISISPDGTISASGAVAGKLKIVEFAPGTVPVAAGNSYYSVPANALRASPESNVRQGMLESSNVNAVKAVVDMIAVQRRAEMLERAMTVCESNLDHIAANDLPKI
jgi:flagellar basal body rod protein FlgG